MDHEWADPAADDPTWAPGRRTTWRVPQDRCRRCLVWKTVVTAETECPGRPGGMETER